MEEKAEVRGHRSRLKNQYLNEEELSDEKILELILFYSIKRRDTSQIAKTLLEAFDGSFERMFSSDVKTLCSIAGIGESTAEFILFFGAVTKRFIECFENSDECSELNSNVLRVKSLAESLHRNEKCNCMDVVFYNGEIEEGVTLRVAENYLHIDDAAILDALAKTVKNNYSNAVLIQHHCAGDCYPHKNDEVFAKKAIYVLSTFGIRLKDYVITSSDGGSFSFAGDYRYCQWF